MVFLKGIPQIVKFSQEPLSVRNASGVSFSLAHNNIGVLQRATEHSPVSLSCVTLSRDIVLP